MDLLDLNKVFDLNYVIVCYSQEEGESDGLIFVWKYLGDIFG